MLEADDSHCPLILISAKSRDYFLSSYRWVKRLREKRSVLRIEIHPQTAGACGIAGGEEGWIRTGDHSDMMSSS